MKEKFKLIIIPIILLALQVLYGVIQYNFETKLKHLIMMQYSITILYWIIAGFLLAFYFLVSDETRRKKTYVRLNLIWFLIVIMLYVYEWFLCKGGNVMMLYMITNAELLYLMAGGHLAVSICCSWKSWKNNKKLKI